MDDSNKRFGIDFATMRGSHLASLFAVTLALGCASASTDSHASGGAGTATAGQPAAGSGQVSVAGGGSSSSGVGGASTGGTSGAPGLSGTGGAGPSGTAGAPGGTSGCPELGVAPASCTTKVFPDDVTLGSQSAVDALAGYTEIGGRVLIQGGGTEPVRNLDALHCLQKIHYELSVSRVGSLTSLDGLDQLTEIGGWLVIEHNDAAKLGCGLRKVAKIGTHSGTPTVDIQDNAQLDRVELSLISGVSHFRIESNERLQTVVGSPAIVTLGQFFIRRNPALTSVTGFGGLKTASEVRLDTNPMLPICQASSIVAGLSALPTVVDTSGDLGSSCP